MLKLDTSAVARYTTLSPDGSQTAWFDESNDQLCIVSLAEANTAFLPVLPTAHRALVQTEHALFYSAI